MNNSNINARIFEKPEQNLKSELLFDEKINKIGNISKKKRGSNVKSSNIELKTSEIRNDEDGLDKKRKKKLTIKERIALGQTYYKITHILQPELKEFCKKFNHQLIMILDAKRQEIREELIREQKTVAENKLQAKLEKKKYIPIRDFQTKDNKIVRKLKCLERFFTLSYFLSDSPANESKKVANRIVRYFRNSGMTKYEWLNPAYFYETESALTQLFDKQQKREFYSFSELKAYFELIFDCNKCNGDMNVFEKFFLQKHSNIDRNLFIFIDENGQEKPKYFNKFNFKISILDIWANNGAYTDNIEIILRVEEFFNKNLINLYNGYFNAHDFIYTPSHKMAIKQMFDAYKRKYYLANPNILKDETTEFMLWNSFDHIFLQTCSTNVADKPLNSSTLLHNDLVESDQDDLSENLLKVKDEKIENNQQKENDVDLEDELEEIQEQFNNI